jgi:glutathione synthase
VSHIFFIDPMEKLNIKKDSSLMMALRFQEIGHEAYLLFEKDFCIDTQGASELTVYSVKGKFKEDGYYLESCELAEKKNIQLSAKDTIHMRIDPPYDIRYQRYLWMLDFLQHSCGVNVINNPLGIMKHNEKLAAFKRKDASLHSYIGSSQEGLVNFLEEQKSKGVTDLIMKPLDLYSGIGVEKVAMDDPKLMDIFNRKISEFQGAIVVQPFLKAVHDGEYRSVYFFGQEVGTILKKPNPGEYLANIAQGAKYGRAELPANLKKECDEIAAELMQDGVPFVAFDLLGDAVQEMNVTCPGLLVEVSYAMEKDLASEFARMFTVND